MRQAASLGSVPKQSSVAKYGAFVVWRQVSASDESLDGTRPLKTGCVTQRLRIQIQLDSSMDFPTSRRLCQSQVCFSKDVECESRLSFVCKHGTFKSPSFQRDPGSCLCVPCSLNNSEGAGCKLVSQTRKCHQQILFPICLAQRTPHHVTRCALNQERGTRLSPRACRGR